MELLVDEKTHETGLVLANAGELATAIIKKIAGNDISTALNGFALTREMVQNILYRKLELSISKNAQ